MTVVTRFLAWWLAELRGLVPARLRERGPRGRLVVSLTPAEAVVLRDGARLGCFRDRRELARVLGGVVVLRLPPGRALWRQVTLPAAAEDNLRQVLAFEMDRQTPWPASDVAFDCRVAARDPARKRIEAEMLVAPRAVVDEVLDLARAWGVVPDAIDAETPSAAAFDLSPPGSRRRRDWVGRLAVAGVALAAAGAVAAMLVGIDRRLDAAEEVRAQVAALEDRARQAAELRSRLDRLDTEALFLARRKAAAPPMVAVIDELTRVLPDSAWIGQLEVADGEVVVTGWSPSASEVVRRMEEAALFRRAEFRSPLVQDPRLGVERFHVAARLAGGAP
ncbi:MAG: PilN domain-containing protein [Pseudomonadota bacterium]